jgi:hypothetical protein
MCRQPLAVAVPMRSAVSLPARSIKGIAGSDRSDIVQEIIAIVNEVAGGLPPGGDDPRDDGMPGG